MEDIKSAGSSSARDFEPDSGYYSPQGDSHRSDVLFNFDAGLDTCDVKNCEEDASVDRETHRDGDEGSSSGNDFSFNAGSFVLHNQTKDGLLFERQSVDFSCSGDFLNLRLSSVYSRRRRQRCRRSFSDPFPTTIFFDVCDTSDEVMVACSTAECTLDVKLDRNAKLNASLAPHPSRPVAVVAPFVTAHVADKTTSNSMLEVGQKLRFIADSFDQKFLLVEQNSQNTAWSIFKKNITEYFGSCSAFVNRSMTQIQHFL